MAKSDMNIVIKPEEMAKYIYDLIEKQAKEFPKEYRQKFYESICESIQTDIGGFPNDTSISDES